MPFSTDVKRSRQVEMSAGGVGVRMGVRWWWWGGGGGLGVKGGCGGHLHVRAVAGI